MCGGVSLTPTVSLLGSDCFTCHTEGKLEKQGGGEEWYLSESQLYVRQCGVTVGQGTVGPGWTVQVDISGGRNVEDGLNSSRISE